MFMTTGLPGEEIQTRTDLGVREHSFRRLGCQPLADVRQRNLVELDIAR
jgi:hypothetical protein